MMIRKYANRGSLNNFVGTILCKVFVSSMNLGVNMEEKKRFYMYDVYEDGKVFSFHTNKFLSGEVTVHGYLQYTLSINGESKRYKAHRLVAQLWINNPNNYEVVNHIDGNKMNNHYSNLEWCDYEHNNKHARETGLNNISQSNSKRWEDENFRNRTSKSISQGIKASGCNVGTRNPNFRYLITQHGKELSRQDVVRITGLSQSCVDSWIKKVANGQTYDNFEKYNIKIVDTKKCQQTIESIAQEKDLCE